MWTSLAGTTILLFHAFAAAAEEAPALGYLNWVRDQIAFVTAEAEAPEEPEKPAAPPPATWAEWWGNAFGGGGISAEELGRMEGEILLLRQELVEVKDTMRQLQDTFDLYMGRILSQAQAENEALRQEVRRLYALAGGENALPPAVPRPGGQLLDDVLNQMAAEAPLNIPPEVVDQTAPYPAEPPAAQPAPLPAGEVPPLAADFAFSVVSEWGRSPEQVETLPGNVASLKGLVGVVPKGSSEQDLIALGRDLRQQYETYDNINIEVFDNAEAAKNYADRSAVNADARVLSISKHKDSGRDVILMNSGGVTREVPVR
jgi:hypothetical protein